MTEQDRLTAYRMYTLIPPPEGIYVNDKVLTKEQRNKFNEITDLSEAHAFYTYWSAKNYTDEFRNILGEME